MYELFLKVKRAVHRLGDQLSIVERNINALKQNSDSVSEDIENINRRLQKAIRDRCESLKTEVSFVKSMNISQFTPNPNCRPMHSKSF